MSTYFLVESGEIAEPGMAIPAADMAADLARSGHDVTVFLVQNGVFPARRSAGGDALAAARTAGVRFLADDFSLRERGIGADGLCTAVAPSPLETVVDRLAAGDKMLWY